MITRRSILALIGASQAAPGFREAIAKEASSADGFAPPMVGPPEAREIPRWKRRLQHLIGKEINRSRNRARPPSTMAADIASKKSWSPVFKASVQEERFNELEDLESLWFGNDKDDELLLKLARKAGIL